MECGFNPSSAYIVTFLEFMAYFGMAIRSRSQGLATRRDGRMKVSMIALWAG